MESSNFYRNICSSWRFRLHHSCLRRSIQPSRRPVLHGMPAIRRVSPACPVPSIMIRKLGPGFYLCDSRHTPQYLCNAGRRSVLSNIATRRPLPACPAPVPGPPLSMASGSCDEPLSSRANSRCAEWLYLWGRGGRVRSPVIRDPWWVGLVLGTILHHRLPLPLPLSSCSDLARHARVTTDLSLQCLGAFRAVPPPGKAGAAPINTAQTCRRGRGRTWSGAVCGQRCVEIIISFSATRHFAGQLVLKAA